MNPLNARIACISFESIETIELRAFSNDSQTNR